MNWMSVLGYAAVLLVTPGAWVTFYSSAAPFSFLSRLTLAVALSPCIASLQAVLLMGFGVHLGTAAVIVLCVNLPSIWLMIRCWRAQRALGQLGRAFSWRVAATVGIVVAVPIAAWVMIPALRPFGWHGLWHTEFCYALATRGLSLEEYDVAGVPLSYPWVYHVFLGMIGWLADRPPSMVFPVTNIALLIVISALIGGSARQLGLGRTGQMAAVLLVLLATNVLRIVLLAWFGLRESVLPFLGDIRYSPFMIKFIGYGVMPYGLTLMCAAGYLCLKGCRVWSNQVIVFLGMTLACLGVVYALIFPIGLGLAGCLGLVWWLAPPGGADRRTVYPRLAWLGMAMLAAVGATYLYLWVITRHRPGPVVTLSSIPDLHLKTGNCVRAFLPLAPLIWIGARRAITKRGAAKLMLLAMGFASGAFYILVTMPNENEYKSVYGTSLCFGLLSAAALGAIDSPSVNPQGPQTRPSPRRWAFPALVWVGGALLAGVWLIHSGIAVSHLVTRRVIPRIDESSFWLRLDPQEIDAAWTRAVDTKTPIDTVMVCEDSRIRLPVFTRRPAYVTRQRNSIQHIGYSVAIRKYLLEDRGVDPDTFDHRAYVLNRLYQGSEPHKAKSLATMRQLNRPLAILIRLPQHADTLRFLEQNQEGKVLYQDPHHVVWFMDAQADTVIGD